MKTVVIIGSPVLHKNYQAALEKAACSAVILPDTSALGEAPDAFDGLLLPGGGDVPATLSGFSKLHPKNSDTALSLEQLHALHLFYQQNKPVFGICKGMQLINLYFHGTIREVFERKLHQHPTKDVFHTANNLPDSFLYALFGSHMSINSNHHQCVDRIGQDLQIIQYAHDETPEALCHLSTPILGTQWHPERMPDAPKDAMLLFRYFVSLL